LVHAPSDFCFLVGFKRSLKFDRYLDAVVAVLYYAVRNVVNYRAKKA
jgi:hypothetical protein